MKSIILSLLLFLSTNVFSASLDGVTLPDSVTLKGKELVLNGLGTRKATWIKVKVYVGGLYMEKKSSDYKTFIDDKRPKQIIMEFVRDVDKSDLVGGWKEAFEGSTPKDKLPAIQDRINTLYTYIGDIKKGQKMVFNFLADGVETTINGKVYPKIEGADFSKAMFSVWFINVIDEGLKKGILGL